MVPAVATTKYRDIDGRNDERQMGVPRSIT